MRQFTIATIREPRLNTLVTTEVAPDEWNNR